MTYWTQSADYFWPIATPLTPETAVYQPDEMVWEAEAVVTEVIIAQQPAAERLKAVLVAVLTMMVVFGLLFFSGQREAAHEVAGASVEAAVVDTAVSAPNSANTTTNHAVGQAISPLFTPEVRYWEPLIVKWAEAYQVDPNMVATIMQIESCGDPQAVSRAGAQGLFQVMPFHFAADENMQDPDTNARRGVAYFAERLAQTNGNVGLAFAGYNGGHVAAATSWENWSAETQRYYTWSTGIYEEVQRGDSESATLAQWLAAGGASLCQQAAARLGIED